MRNRFAFAMALLGTSVMTHPVLAQEAAARAPLPSAADPLLEQFRDPPQSARPRVWWHWMNGNVTKDGIRKDLEWMKRAGIGGLQNFDANLITPQIVKERLVYMHPEWKDAFRFAAATADELGLELAIASSPGWSETGGPWVPPEDGMKKLVWSETTVEGGKRFNGKIAGPPSATGPYQNMTATDPLAAITGNAPEKQPERYGDIAVMAFPVTSAAMDVPVVTNQDGHALDAGALIDGNPETVVAVAKGSKEKPTAVIMTYARPQVVRSATIFTPDGGGIFGGSSMAPKLEYSEDGKVWKAIADVTASAVPTTVSFTPVTARFFRATFEEGAPQFPSLGEPAPGVEASSMMDAMVPKASPTLRVADVRLSGEARVDHGEFKAGFVIAPDYYALSKGVPDTAGIDPAGIINLTDRLKSDGSLDWTPPKGRWRILRLGWSLIGTVNHPATQEATGLEVDKYDGEAVSRYIDHYIGMYKDAAGADLLGKRGVRALLTDSIEVGASNWTPKLVAQFKTLRGYDPTPYLPALAGIVVQSREASDKFLYDFRRTLADLIASQHYGVIAEAAHKNDLIIYGEALEMGRPNLGDDMAMRAHTDIPMSAMWTYPRGVQRDPAHVADMKGAASIANIYGQNLVAAESMTASMNPWNYAPADLRHVIDLEFANGINRPVIHTSVHVPVDDHAPGLSLAIFGQYFNRQETWAEMARPWVDYISRNDLMLQQGHYQADVAYFYGEEGPMTQLFGKSLVPDAPNGYGYDFANADALLNRFTVDQGNLVTAAGGRYRVLYLGGSSGRMTLPVLRRIAELAESGVSVVGNAPGASPSLKDDAGEFARLVGKLWGGGAVTQVGKGRVFAGNDVQVAFDAMQLKPDFTYSRSQPDTRIVFQHRRTADGEIYYLNNRQMREEKVEARFRVTGKLPEIWRADTGKSEPVSYRIENGETIVPLTFSAEDSYFVVFRKPAAQQASTLQPAVAGATITLSAPWKVTFQTGRGAPPSIALDTLRPLNEHDQAGVKYFSGISTYTTQFTLPANSKGKALELDLGKVGDIAEVRVNGTLVGTSWHAPWKVKLGDAVKPGVNQLEIRVANVWVNRLIGDKQPGAEKVTWTALPTYQANAPLRPSGLIGPVTITAFGK